MGHVYLQPPDGKVEHKISLFDFLSFSFPFTFICVAQCSPFFDGSELIYSVQFIGTIAGTSTNIPSQLMRYLMKFLLTEELHKKCLIVCIALAKTILIKTEFKNQSVQTDFILCMHFMHKGRKHTPTLQAEINISKNHRRRRHKQIQIETMKVKRI